MITTIQTLVLLLAVAAAVAVVAARLKIPQSILLVLTGVVLALIPGLPTVELAPEFVLLVVLPPVVYASAVDMSWREFKFNLRPITLLAVGCVLFTTVAVAAAAHCQRSDRHFNRGCGGSCASGRSNGPAQSSH